LSFVLNLIIVHIQFHNKMKFSTIINEKMNTLRRCGIFIAFALFLFPLLFTVKASGLSSASAVLSNPRLSFHALVNTTIPIGGSVAIVKASGSGGDYDTRNLFPGDSVVISANSAVSVASVSSDLVTFTLKTSLLSAGNADTNMTVAQAGTLTVTFYTASPIPAGGSIKISIPAPVSGGSDGLPISATNVDVSGFDTNSMTGSHVTCPGGFNTAAVTSGTGGATHTVTCNNTGGAVPAGADITFVVGNGAVGLVNPPPTQGRAAGQRGIADIYNIIASTHSGTAGGGSLIEDVQMKVAPDEGVLVSATIGETLSFSVAAVVSANINSTCGFTPVGNLVNSTATSIPFGSSILSNTFYNAAQQLTVFTNAPGGYSVKVEENDQMGKDGKVCTTALAGEANDCIKDTTCDAGSCTQATKGEWSTSTNNGLGYSLSNISPSTDAAFEYDDAGLFSAKQFPDQEVPETKEVVMNNTGIVNGNSACIIYRLTVPGTQPAGYYFNKIKYTASATF